MTKLCTSLSSTPEVKHIHKDLIGLLVYQYILFLQHHFYNESNEIASLAQ